MVSPLDMLAGGQRASSIGDTLLLGFYLTQCVPSATNKVHLDPSQVLKKKEIKNPTALAQQS